MRMTKSARSNRRPPLIEIFAWLLQAWRFR